MVLSKKKLARFQAMAAYRRRIEVVAGEIKRLKKLYSAVIDMDGGFNVPELLRGYEAQLVELVLLYYEEKWK
jgi:hypothetical protein